MKHAFLVPLMLLAACKSAKPAPPPALPMRVAIVPLEEVRTRGPSADERGKATDMRLELDKAEFTRAIAAALDRSVFADAIVLTQPLADARAGGGAQTVDWNELALREGADLILELSLSSQTSIVERGNVNYYLNFPLFLVGGPFCWFLKDHTYSAETSLSAWIYDVRKIKRSTASLGNDASFAARVVPAGARFSQLDLNFYDRSSSAGWYALSIVCPSPLLATDNDALRSTIETEVMSDLSRGLANDLRASRDNLIDVPSLAPFHLDVDAARVEELGAGRWKLTADVLLPSSRSDQPERCILRLGASVAEHPIGAPRPASDDPASLAFPIEIEFDAPAGEEFVGLEVIAESVATASRSYTFALPTTR